MSPGCTIRLVFFCSLSALFQHVDLVTTCLRAGFQVLSLPLLGLPQGPAPDPKCKLNISWFLTLPHLLNCLICTTNSVSIVLLLWMMGVWHMLGGGWFISGCYWGTAGVYYLIVSFFFYLCFCILFSCPVSFFKWVENDSCVYFFVYYLFSLSPVPLTSSYWGMEIVSSVM